MLKRSLEFIIILFSFCLIFLNGCRTSEPTMPEYNPAVSDTLKIVIQDSTLNSIKLGLISSSREPGTRKVMLYRLGEDTTSIGTLLIEYPISNKDTVILDNNSGKGLLMGKDYKYRAMIVDPIKNKEYQRQEITAKTLSLTGDDYSWTELTFGEFQSHLHSVWGIDENHIYAAGTVVLNGKVNGIMRWDGTSWNSELPFGGFLAIYGFSSNDIWAAGGSIVHYDGNVWNQMGERVDGDHVVPIDSVIFTHRTYLAIWGTSSSNMFFGDYEGYIIHWDGKKAHVEDVKSSLPFRDMWGNSASDIYAVSGLMDNGQGELYHFDGSRWSLIKKGVIYPGENELIGPFNTVWSYNGEELLVGGNLVAREQSGKWTEATPLGFYIEKIRGDKPNNVFVCGHFASIAHFNGSKWTKLMGKNNTGTVVLHDIFVKDDYVYAVGRDGTKAYIYYGKRKK